MLRRTPESGRTAEYHESLKPTKLYDRTSDQITLDEVKQRVQQWKTEPFQADAADYFLSGPGQNEQPFAAVLRLVSQTQ